MDIHETTPDSNKFENKSKNNAKESDLCESQNIILNRHLVKLNLMVIRIIWCFVYIFWRGLQIVIEVLVVMFD
jgi:hypothetical protein